MDFFILEILQLTRAYVENLLQIGFIGVPFGATINVFSSHHAYVFR